jgi:hypothetical protein
MFDDCNDFFKWKADGRDFREARAIPAIRKGVESALLLSAVYGASAQYLHRSSVVLSWARSRHVHGCEPKWHGAPIAFERALDSRDAGQSLARRAEREGPGCPPDRTDASFAQRLDRRSRPTPLHGGRRVRLPTSARSSPDRSRNRTPGWRLPSAARSRTSRPCPQSPFRGST